MKPNFILILGAASAVSLVLASGPHSAGPYTVQPAVLDGGGGKSTSATYANDGSLLDLAGTATGGIYSASPGYAIQITADPSAVCAEFIAWQTMHFGSPAAANAGASLDPDKDGTVNLAEFAFNMNPLTPDAAALSPGGSSGLPRLTVETVQGRQRLTIEFIARTTCLSWQLESAGDLTNWSPAAHIEVSPPVPLGNGLERRKWADPGQVGGDEQHYLRVRLTL